MSSSNITVYTGVWKNWSEGSIRGATISLSTRNGVILVAALALFIQLSGVHSWSIISFIVHQLKATRERRDGLYHQQQATLRNNISDVGTLWRFTAIAMAWRPLKRRSFLRSIGIIFLALVHLLCFTAAGILSSHFTKLGNDVLIARSPSCGLWQGPDFSNMDDWEALFAADVAFDVYQQTATQASKQYVQNCLVQSQTLPECEMFKRTKLTWTTKNTTCPFTGGICAGPSNVSLRLDTGFVDSRNDLGINSQDDARVQFRRTTTCIPLVNEPYIRIQNTTIVNETTIFELTAAFYGPNSQGPALNGLYPDASLQNATYVTSRFQIYETPYDDSILSPYVVNVVKSYPNSSATSFTAIPQLHHDDANVILIFASTSGTYTGPSDDLWLPATGLGTELISVAPNGTEIRTPEWILDYALNVLGCTEQYQFCNPSTVKCTPMESINVFSTSNSSFDTIFNSDYQKTVAWIIQSALSAATLDNTVMYLEGTLLANDLTQGMTSLPLPNNQWTQEVNNWFSISMNNLQRSIVAVATGPGGANNNYTTGQADRNPSLQQFCDNQIIQRSDFMNFSVLAISLIFGLGALIIVLSLCLEDIVGGVRKRWSRGGLYRQVRWQMDSTLQLQKWGFEGAGLGSWKQGGGVKDVPVTETGEEFARRVEWEDAYMSREMRDRKDRFLSPLEEVEIVTGDFSFEGFRDEERRRGEGEEIELTPVNYNSRSLAEGEESDLGPITHNSGLLANGRDAN